MKSLSCMEVSGNFCPFIARGKTKKEVKRKMMEHEDEVHANTMDHMSSSQIRAVKRSMEAKMDRLIS